MFCFLLTAYKAASEGTVYWAFSQKSFALALYPDF